jgi:hypothetical protein
MANWQLLMKRTVAPATWTGSTGQNTFDTLTLPAGMMGPTGIMRIVALWSFVSGGTPGTRTTQFVLGGQVLNGPANANNLLSYRSNFLVMNRSLSSQIVSAPTSGNTPFGTFPAAAPAFAINTGIDQPILFRGQLGNAGDSMTLEAYTIEVMPLDTSWVTAGAAIDLDFVDRRYYWGGLSRDERDFTTFNPGNSTLNANGLTPIDNTVDITLSLSGLGFGAVGSFAVVVTHPASSPQARYIMSLDVNDLTPNNRISILMQTTGADIYHVMNASVLQCALTSAVLAVGTRYGMAASYNTNNFLASLSGTALTADVTGTPITPTMLRVGRSPTLGTPYLGSIRRVVAFTAAQTQGQLDALSVALRDAS